MPILHNWGMPRLGSRTGQNVAYDLMGVRSRLLATAYAVSMNTASTDVIVPINAVPGGYTGTINYIVRGFLAFNASASLATSPTISLYTGAGATGTALVSAQAVTGLTTSAVWADLTLAVTTTGNILQGVNLYIRTGSSNQVAATCDFYIYGEVLP